MKRQTQTTERTLYDPVRDLAEEYVDTYGTLKAVLSAGVLALSRMNPEDRTMLVREVKALYRAGKNTPKDESPGTRSS